MPDQPHSEREGSQDRYSTSAGRLGGRQLIFPENVARNNQVRPRIPLVAEAPVFEFEPVAPPPPSRLPKVSRRWRMRLRQFFGRYVVSFVVVLLLSVLTVAIVAILSPTPKSPVPPVRR
ncbi:MAG: hypothetical protein ACUVR8_07650 [Acidobacteriota bacterium]